MSCVTTVDAALAAVQGLAERTGEVLTVKTLQEYHATSGAHGGDRVVIDTRVTVGSRASCVRR